MPVFLETIELLLKFGGECVKKLGDVENIEAWRGIRSIVTMQLVVVKNGKMGPKNQGQC